MEQLKKAYGNLYDAIKGSKFEEGLCKERIYSEYTTFTAMKGHLYEPHFNKYGKEFRFMIVGRAVNGWDEYRKNQDSYMSRENFVESSIMNLMNDKRTLATNQAKDRFEWIKTEGDQAHNTEREGIDRYPEIIKEQKYVLNRSQFWNYSKSIWDSLNGEVTTWSERWFENIVWSNLYKIAPCDAGNPGGWLQRRERAACIEVLKAEIDYLKPTHIFFATARDWWFDYFKEIFTNVTKLGTNQFSGENKGKDFVEATAKYTYADGTQALVVVACRPEGRDKDAYVKQVVEYFQNRYGE